MKGQLVKIVKGFFSWARRSGHIASDPAAALEKPQGHEEHPTSWKQKEFPSDHDIRLVLAASTQDERDQILIGRHTGSEPASLRHMLWRDVDFAAREVKIGRKKNRSASLKQHIVPLSNDALACLRRRCGDGKAPDERVFPSIITVTRWKWILKKASRTAKREVQFGRAVFKHMFRTALANNIKLTVAQVQAMTGCSWETLSRHYVKPDTRPAHEVISEMFGGSNSGSTSA
jgi:integrase